MLGHVRRHVNKGETKSRYIAGKLSNLINMLVNKSLNNGPIIPSAWPAIGLIRAISWKVGPTREGPWKIGCGCVLTTRGQLC